jgi:DNA repair exonuclease SbcCD nuclease subunit
MATSSEQQEPQLTGIAQEIQAIYPQPATRRDFRIASASDLHLGHGKNPPEEMVERLKKRFPRDAETAKLDVIVLAGDVYDHLLNLPQDHVSVIDDWIIYMLRLCKALGIQLWVLRGTPSHDRDQSARFVWLNETLEIGCDLLYVDTLRIVWMPKFSIHVLFVPDEWTDDADKTLEEVKDLMRQQGIDKVDYAVMHGQFEFQLPPVVKAQKHSSAAYLALVRYLIFIGHVHLFNRLDRIIAQGSFDRISHGEEMPKGHVRAIVRSEDDYEIQFVETEDAKIFHTVDCRGLGVEECHEKILTEIEPLPDGSHIRILADTGNPILQAVAQYEKDCPHFFWTGLGKADEDKSLAEQTEMLQNAMDYTPIEITRQNVQKLMSEKLSLMGLDPEIFNLAERKLAELV